MSLSPEPHRAQLPSTVSLGAPGCAAATVVAAAAVASAAAAGVAALGAAVREESATETAAGAVSAAASSSEALPGPFPGRALPPRVAMRRGKAASSWTTNARGIVRRCKRLWAVPVESPRVFVKAYSKGFFLFGSFPLTLENKLARSEAASAHPSAPEGRRRA